MFYLQLRFAAANLIGSSSLGDNDASIGTIKGVTWYFVFMCSRVTEYNPIIHFGYVIISVELCTIWCPVHKFYRVSTSRTKLNCCTTGSYPVTLIE